MASRLLVVAVDTEEEGTWGREKVPGAERSSTVANIEALPRLHRVLDPLGVTPCYLVDYPVASDRAAVGFLR